MHKSELNANEATFINWSIFVRVFRQAYVGLEWVIKIEISLLWSGIPVVQYGSSGGLIARIMWSGILSYSHSDTGDMIWWSHVVVSKRLELSVYHLSRHRAVLGRGCDK
ncbi:hypothetical protein NPIL_324111 [Nephila pilipes]|uniref:Uncharacterized protein n=1 Tax=Nephila pilipes TaxID=299642 RepID=A0A8X6QNK5_NEPPI|nr:hypothetical protein NPIL_324111 [Nephila pilipes]